MLGARGRGGDGGRGLRRNPHATGAAGGLRSSSGGGGGGAGAAAAARAARAALAPVPTASVTSVLSHVSNPHTDGGGGQHGGAQLRRPRPPALSDVDVEIDSPRGVGVVTSPMVVVRSGAPRPPRVPNTPTGSQQQLPQPLQRRASEDGELQHRRGHSADRRGGAGSGSGGVGGGILAALASGRTSPSARGATPVLGGVLASRIVPSSPSMVRAEREGAVVAMGSPFQRRGSFDMPPPMAPPVAMQPIAGDDYDDNVMV